MRRRDFISGIAGSAAAWPLAVRAQQAGRVAKIGILAYGNRFDSPLFDRFRGGLRDLGYVEGRNATTEFRTAADNPASVGDLAAELARLPVDVIVTDGTPSALAAKQATATIPIVMAVIVDPVGTGLVSSYARPGGNITGFTILAPELGTKRLEILKETVPGLNRVGLLWNAINPLNATPQVPPIIEAARALGLEIEAGPVRNPDEFEPAFEKFKARQVSAIMTVADGMMFEERRRIVDLATAARLPGIYPDRPFADAGGLLFYGPLVVDLFRRAAGYVDRILKGAKPADLPIEQPTRFSFVINLKAAKALGLAIPETLLIRADEVIE
jgi:putative tryptophan/tyrosine transport system substrate-binding protein